jgi:glutamate racemase
MQVIDSAEAAAETAARLFLHLDSQIPIQHPSEERSPTAQVRCFATDSVEKFERLGSRFLNRPVGKVELVDLGG